VVVAGYHTGGESLSFVVDLCDPSSRLLEYHICPLEIENRSLLLTPNDFHLAPQTSIFITRMKIGMRASKDSLLPPTRGVLRARPAYFNLFRRRRRRAYTITVSRVIKHET